MFEMNQIKVYVGDNRHVCLSQDDGPEYLAIIFFNPCQAELIAQAILLSAKEAIKSNEEEAFDHG